MFFIRLSVEGHLGCFHILAIANNAAVNMGVPVPLWDPVYFLWLIYPEVGIPGSYGNSIPNLLRSHLTVFHSGRALFLRVEAFWTILASPSGMAAMSGTIHCDEVWGQRSPRQGVLLPPPFHTSVENVCQSKAHTLHPSNSTSGMFPRT